MGSCRCSFRYNAVSFQNDKLNVMLASGDIPDIFAIRKAMDNMQIMASRGYTMALDELVKKSPEITSLVDQKYLGYLTVDGKLHGVPMYVPMSKVIWLRKDLIDKYGVKLSETHTTEEFYNEMKKLAGNDFVPFTFTKFLDNLPFFLNPFGASFGIGKDANGKFFDGFNTPEAKEALTFVSGERYYFLKDKTFRIKKGHLVFINEGEVHKTTDAEKPDHERILVYFSKDFIHTPNHLVDDIIDMLAGKEYCVIGLSLKEQQAVETIFHDMGEEIAHKSLGFEICLQALLMKLLVFIGRHTADNDITGYISDSPKHEKVSEIVRHIDANFTEELSVHVISRLFFISPFYLCRIFKETTGFTLVEYINNARVNEARRLLGDHKLKVIQVAEKAGFGSIAQFNRTFRKLAGCSPLNYRKKLR